MQKAGIIGHYGFGLDLANGQTIKTKIVTEYVSKAIDNRIIKVDAHGGIKAIIPVILGCIKCLKTCENVIILLTENGLRVSVPILVAFNRIYHRKLHYVVIGGWLNKFLDSHKGVESGLKKFDNIYVETKTMENALKKKGFINVVIMPNCKRLKVLESSDLPETYSEPFPICTFSRVMKEKGIETIANVVNRVNQKNKRTIYKLDIYGQVDSTQTEWFEKISSAFPEYIAYKGIVPFAQSVDVLKDYYLLIFPTHFYTEGIPGTIIDAYAAGVPVVSSKWESFADVVDEGKTGLGYTFDNSNELEMILELAAKEPNRIIQMKEKCLKKAQDFSLDEALKVLISRL